MSVAYNFKKGVHFPNWQQLPPFQNGITSPGTSKVYDGSRYIYWAIQYGSTVAGTASTTQLHRFDTWSHGWQFLATLTSGNQGIDIEFDPNRNCLYILNGAALTSWQVFNLNTIAVTICGQSIPAFSVATVTAPVLPTAASIGASITMPSDGGFPLVIDSQLTGTGSTTGTLVLASNVFTPGHVGAEVTVGGTKATIQTVTGPTTATILPVLGSAPAAGVAVSIELPTRTATAGSTTTLTDTGASYIVNQYSNHDLIISAGTGIGQRRRIASNTATILTLATAVTGNANTGPFTTAPDATSVYRIVPSQDFLYYFPANSVTNAWKLDVSQTTGAAWVALTAVPGAPGGGANSFYTSSIGGDFILIFRGAASASIYWYNIGLNTYVTPTVYAGSETFTTGASAASISAKKKLYIDKEGTQRNYMLDLTTNVYEPAPQSPYVAPVAYDGKRAQPVVTPDGILWMYNMRSGGQEFFRFPLEWI